MMFASEGGWSNPDVTGWFPGVPAALHLSPSNNDNDCGQSNKRVASECPPAFYQIVLPKTGAICSSSFINCSN